VPKENTTGSTFVDNQG